MHLAVDSHGMPVRISLTSGTVADCTELAGLIEGIEPSFYWQIEPTTPMPSWPWPPSQPSPVKGEGTYSEVP